MSFNGVFPGAYDAESAPSTFNETLLSEGEVTDVFPPDYPLNRSKTTNEYLIELQYRVGAMAPTARSIRANLMTSLSGIADRSSHSLRARTAVAAGDRVLVLFLNGDENFGVIVGGLQNLSAPKDHLGKASRFLKWVFNGVAVNINDDGELRLRVNGATKNDGTPDSRDDTNNGPYIQFTKDGNFYVTDNNGQSITVNPREKAVQIRATESAQLNAKRIQLGSQMSAENLVLGQQLIAALNDLVMTVFLKGAPNLGKCAVGPVVLDPTMVMALTQWKIKWLTSIGGPPQILSAKAYTER